MNWPREPHRPHGWSSQSPAQAVSAELAASQAEVLRLVAETEGQLAAEQQAQQARITADEVAQVAEQAPGLAEREADEAAARTGQAGGNHRRCAANSVKLSAARSAIHPVIGTSRRIPP